MTKLILKINEKMGIKDSTKLSLNLKTVGENQVLEYEINDKN